MEDYKYQLEKILSRYMGESSSGAVKVTWSNQDIQTEIIAAIDALNAKTIGGDREYGPNDLRVVIEQIKTEIRVKADLRHRFGIGEEAS